MNRWHDKLGRFASKPSGAKASSGAQKRAGAALQKAFHSAVGRQMKRGISTGINAGGFPTIGITNKKEAAKGLKIGNAMSRAYRASKYGK